MSSSNANDRTALKQVAADVRRREAETVRLRLAGKNFDEIAEEVGYASRGAAYDAYKRAIKANTVTNVGELQELVSARIEAMFGSLYPVAMGDLETVWQWVGKGKDRKPVECEDDHLDVELGGDHLHVDNGGRQVCYIIPSMAKVAAADQCNRLLKELRNVHGLDFSHGLAQRQQDMEAAYGQEVLKLMKAVFDEVFNSPELSLTAEQKAAAGPVAKVAMMEQYKAAKGAI